jgi:predicted dehydrogenase
MAHMRELARIPQAEIVAVCDVDEFRARAAAETSHASTYGCAEDLISRERLDALYICVPPNAHGDLEILAARKGIHLFVEKPVNLSLRQALRVSTALRESGVMTQTGYVLRYIPLFIRARAFLQDKEIGTAHVTRWNGLVGPPWWRRMDASGGQLVEMTTHQVDLLRWIMCEVDSVSAYYSMSRLYGDDAEVSIPDSQSVMLRFCSGAVATINTSCAIGKSSLGRMEFAIKDAMVRVERDSLDIDPPDRYPAPEVPDETPGIDASFVHAVLSGDRSLLRSPYDDAVKTLAITLAANLSAEEGGRPIDIESLIREAGK